MEEAGAVWLADEVAMGEVTTVPLTVVMMGPMGVPVPVGRSDGVSGPIGVGLAVPSEGDELHSTSAPATGIASP